MVLTVQLAATEYLAKPKGPSWSPFLAVGMVVLFAVVIVLLLSRSGHPHVPLRDLLLRGAVVRRAHEPDRGR